MKYIQLYYLLYRLSSTFCALVTRIVRTDERERERGEGETDRQTQTGTDRHRQTQTQTDRQTDR